jgi:hypothetical protein
MPLLVAPSADARSGSGAVQSHGRHAKRRSQMTQTGIHGHRGSRGRQLPSKRGQWHARQNDNIGSPNRETLAALTFRCVTPSQMHPQGRLFSQIDQF